jgi:hypothetical protein
VKCAYDVPCKAPVIYRVIEKAIGARPQRERFACAEHYPGKAFLKPPTERVELRFYIIEPLAR